MNTTATAHTSFDSELATATVLRGVTDYPIIERSVIVNLAMGDALSGTVQLAPLPPLSSTMLLHGRVSGELLLVVNASEREDSERIARALGWLDFYGPNGPVLLKSPQDVIGTVEVDRRIVLRQEELAPDPRPFVVKANLWFSPAGTDCGVHNIHPFIEVHTQIAGYGRMQKFDSRGHDSLYEDQQLSPGTTNPVPFCLDRDGEFTYPWHQYRADTDCIWLALEYHAA